ncbi:MAG: hypothetical protein EA385_12915 [Salinarimonadaceae bacterium]|nr:MAG: hypothetical protein EA385_12915 [Salinarimonadaceae bacterium]
MANMFDDLVPPRSRSAAPNPFADLVPQGPLPTPERGPRPVGDPWRAELSPVIPPRWTEPKPRSPKPAGANPFADLVPAGEPKKSMLDSVSEITGIGQGQPRTILDDARSIGSALGIGEGNPKTIADDLGSAAGWTEAGSRAAAQGVLASVGGIVEGVGIIGRQVGVGGQAPQDAGRAISDFGESIGPSPEYRGVATDIISGVAAMLTYLIPGGAAAAAVRGAGALARGSAGIGAASMMAGPAGAAEAYNRAVDYGVPDEEALKIAMWGIPAGVVQVAPVAVLLRQIPPNLRGKAVGQIRHIAEAFGAEFIAEGTGAWWQNLIEQSYNPDRGTWDDTLYQGIIGGSAGALTQIGISLATRGRGLFAGPRPTQGRAGDTRIDQEQPSPDMPESPETAPPVFDDFAGGLRPDPVIGTTSPANDAAEQGQADASTEAPAEPEQTHENASAPDTDFGSFVWGEFDSGIRAIVLREAGLPEDQANLAWHDLPHSTRAAVGAVLDRAGRTAVEAPPSPDAMPIAEPAEAVEAAPGPEATLSAETDPSAPVEPSAPVAPPPEIAPVAPAPAEAVVQPPAPVAPETAAPAPAAPQPAPIDALPDAEARLLLGLGYDADMLSEMSAPELAAALEEAVEMQAEPAGDAALAELRAVRAELAAPVADISPEAIAPGPVETVQAPADPFADLIPEQRGDGSRTAPVDVVSPADVETAARRVVEPTPAQAEVGNYAKGHMRWRGLDIAIETPQGAQRTGTDSGGNPWSVTMPAHYGYVKRTTGRDGDQVDVYIGPRPQARSVFVVDQIDPETGKFDEHKAMIGFVDQAGAEAAYDAAFSDGRGRARAGAITPMSVDEFKSWLKSGKTRRPVAYKAPRSPAAPKARQPREPRTIIEFIASKGGIRPDDPLIADIRGVLGKKNRPVPGFGGALIREAHKGGQYLDDLRGMAADAGFFGYPIDDAASRTRVDDLVQLVDRETRGGRRAGLHPDDPALAERDESSFEEEASQLERRADDLEDARAEVGEFLARIDDYAPADVWSRAAEIMVDYDVAAPEALDRAFGEDYAADVEGRVMAGRVLGDQTAEEMADAWRRFDQEAAAAPDDSAGDGPGPFGDEAVATDRRSAAEGTARDDGPRDGEDRAPADEGRGVEAARPATALFRGVRATPDMLQQFISSREAMIAEWTATQKQVSAGARRGLQENIDSARQGIAEARALIESLDDAAPNASRPARPAVEAQPAPAQTDEMTQLGAVWGRMPVDERAQYVLKGRLTVLNRDGRSPAAQIAGQSWSSLTDQQREKLAWVLPNPAISQPVVEAGAEGLPQSVIPGAEARSGQDARAALNRQEAERVAEARQQQSMIRRGDQRRVEDDESGLFGERRADMFGDAEFSRAPAPGQSEGAPRSRGIPREAAVPIADFRSDQDIKAHPDYEAAVRLVTDLVKHANIRAANARFGSDVIYAPVIAQERAGQNAIPEMLASYYAEVTGAGRTGDIVQTNRAYHTGESAMGRLSARASFDGPVEAGRRYVIVDDVSVMGSTVADMADHIQRGGGEVAGVVLLANAGRQGVLKADSATVTKIKGRFGDAIQELFGLDPDGLTANEAAYILNFRDADALRTRKSAADRQRADRIRAQGLQEPQGGSDGDVGDFRAAPPRPRLSDAQLAEVGEIIARVSGLSEFQTQDTIEMRGDMPGGAAWGLAPGESSNAAGAYSAATDAIVIALDYGSPRTAYHESFHRLLEWFMNKAEHRVLRGSESALRGLVARDPLHASVAAAMSTEETIVEGFAIYSRALDAGDPVTGLPNRLRAVLTKLYRLARAVGNWLQGNGFRTWESIFEDAYSGAIAARGRNARPGEPGAVKFQTFSSDARDRAAQANEASGASPIQGAAQPRLPLPPSFPTPKRKPGLLARLRGSTSQATEQATIREQFDDKFDMMRRIKDAIEKVRGSPLPESHDALLSTHLYSTRSAQQLEAYREKEVRPISDAIAEEGLALDDVGLYLVAKHAPERNAEMARRNPQAFGQGGGSGMTDAAAADILADLQRRGLTPKLKRIASMTRALIARDLDRRLAAGLISQKQYDAWKSMYRHYVPLRGFAERDDDAGPVGRMGQGFDVRGRESKAALGRHSLSDHPLMQAVLMGQEGIVRAEKNKVGKVLLRQIQKYPNEDLFEVVGKLPMRQFFDEKTQMVREMVDFGALNEAAIMGVKIGGENRYIKINDPVLAQAYKNIGVGLDPNSTWTSAFRFFQVITRQFSRLQTSANPDFVMPNMQSDFLEGVLTAFNADKKGLTKALLKNEIPALVAATAKAFGRSAGKKWDALYDEWLDAGGKINFMAFRDVDEIARDIEREVRSAGGQIDWAKMPLELPQRALQALERVNQPFEDATRLAMYAAARELGISKPRAAAMAIDVSGNYTRRGLATPHMSAAYAFFNPAVKGIEKFWRFLQSPRAAAILAGIPVASFGLALANMRFSEGDDDPEGRPLYLSISEWERSRSIIIPTGIKTDENGIKRLQFTPFRVPHNARPLWTLGEQLAAVVMGHQTASGAMHAFSMSIVQNFNPWGADNILNALAPTAVDPFVDLYNNRTWTGAPIKPDEQRWNQGIPQSSQYWRGRTNETIIDFTQALNRLTGGTSVQPGWVDLSPNQIEYLIDYITGGAGRFAKRGVESAFDAYHGVGRAPERVPIVRMFRGETNYFAERRRYFDLRSDVEADQNRLRALWRSYRENPTPELEAEAVEMFSRMNARPQGGTGERIDWTRSVTRPFTNADRVRRDLEDSIYALRADKSLTHAERRRREIAIEAEIEKVMRQARREYVSIRGAAGGAD